MSLPRVSVLPHDPVPLVPREQRQPAQAAEAPRQPIHSGLAAAARVAGFQRIAADPAQLAHQLGLGGRIPSSEDLVRAARLVGPQGPRAARHRLQRAPKPAIITSLAVTSDARAGRVASFPAGTR